MVFRELAKYKSLNSCQQSNYRLQVLLSTKSKCNENSTIVLERTDFNAYVYLNVG